MAWDFGGGDSARSDGDEWSEPAPAPRSPTTTWEDPEASSMGGSEGAVSAPGSILAIGFTLAAISVILALVSDSATLACIGWLLGGPLAIGCIAVFLQVDTQRRSSPWY